MACNTPIQGSGADCIKLAMVMVDEMVPEADPVACVHDELIYEVPDKGAEELAGRIVSAMELAGAELVKCVPMPAEAEIAKEWVKV